MALGEHDHDIMRRYLLGQLTDEEEQKLEERLLSEDDLYQEVELTKDELAQEYASGELSSKERKWLQENFLASPEGKHRHEFAKTFDQYVSNHRPKNPGLIERLRTIWNTRPQVLTAATTAAVLVIAIGVYMAIPRSTPRTIASLTVTSSAGERSTGSVPQRVSLRDHYALQLTLPLPQAAPPGSAYRVEVSSNDNKVTLTYDTRSQDTQSISVQILAAELPPGFYSATVSTVDANDNAHRLPDNYTFKVE